MRNIGINKALNNFAVQKSVLIITLKRERTQKADNIPTVRSHARAVKIHHGGTTVGANIVIDVGIAVNKSCGDLIQINEAVELGLHNRAGHTE